MKPLLTLIAVFFVTQLFAQNSKSDSDTLLLRNGAYFYGTFINETMDYYHFKHFGEKRAESYRKDEVLRIGKWQPDTTKTASILKQATQPDTMSLQTFYKEFKQFKEREEQSGIFLKKQGGGELHQGY